MGPGATVRVLVAEDHSLMREGILHRLGQAPDIEVVDCVEDGAALVASYRQHAPDVVVTDFRMPTMTGLDALIAIRRLDPDAKVVLLSGFDDGKLVTDAVQAGAAGFLTKSLSGAELCDHIRAAARGEPAFSAEATRLLMDELSSVTEESPPKGAAVRKLSERELEIIGLVAEGLTNVQIARRLFLSPQTVKTHMERIFSKLGVKGRAAAVSRAMTDGLLG